MNSISRRRCASGQLCSRCGMYFALASPGPGAEITRCAETDCGQRFWHFDRGRDAGTDGRPPRAEPRVAVGIDPAWHAAAELPVRSVAS